MTAKLIASITLVLFVLMPSKAALAGDLSPIKSRPKAPDFELLDLKGKKLRLSQQHGKVVLVHFWATWCPPCRAEMKALQQATQKLPGNKFNILAIAMGEDHKKVSVFHNRLGVRPTFPFLPDARSLVSKAWVVKSLPTTYVVDPKGRVVYIARGPREWHEGEVFKKIKGLL